MKKIITASIMCLVVTVISLNNLKADTEAPSGGSDISCIEPMSNTCVVIHKPWPLKDQTLKGVLLIKSL